jgi:pyruvate formate lyase activating enzyme
MKKRTAIAVVAVVAIIAAAGLLLPPDAPAPPPSPPPPPAAVEGTTREARFWQPLDGGRVRCLLCVHRCIVPGGGRGICRVRENRDGRLYTLVYGPLASTQVAPIEKDGMKHALPGTNVLAIATAGCNFRCKQCHNWHITQRGPERVWAPSYTPQGVVDLALRRGARTITGTINEPTVFFEFLYDVAVLARERGLRMQVHTNGAIAEAPLRALLRRVDQVVVDLKGFCPEVYREYYGGCLESVLATLRIIREEGAWLEITNLVIPGVNDCLDGIRAMSEWIVANLGPDVPLLFTRFHPAYRLTHLPPTPIETLEEAHRVAREAGINFVTIGNVPGHTYNSTFCPDTGERLIHRVHFSVIYNKVVDGRSPFSGRPVPGVWE